jgi:type 1 fimbriae regulatory protein FimE
MKNQVVSVEFSKAEITETLKVKRPANRSRLANDELRGKRHLTLDEVDQICKVIHRKSRNPGRNELMILMSFHHGFRVSELTSVKWQHIDLKSGQLSVRRMKNGIDTVHPISDKSELMLLKRIHREQLKPTAGFVFRNERGSPVSVNGFQKMFGRFSELALGVKWNSHSLRHACGTALIDKGHDLRTVQVYMGHRNIQNTTVYLHESAKQFDKIEW